MKEQYLWNVPASVIRFAEAVTEELGSDLYTLPGDLRDHIIKALFEKRKRQLYNMLMRIRNGSPAAVRVCEMFDRGEIDGERMLELLGSAPNTMFA